MTLQKKESEDRREAALGELAAIVKGGQIRGLMHSASRGWIGILSSIQHGFIELGCQAEARAVPFIVAWYHVSMPSDDMPIIDEPQEKFPRSLCVILVVITLLTALSVLGLLQPLLQF